MILTDVFIVPEKYQKLLPEVVGLKPFWLLWVFFIYICTLGLHFKLHVTFAVFIHFHITVT